MFGAVAKRLFGSANDRLVKSMRKTVDRINALEPTVAALSDDAAAGQDRRVPRPAGARARRSTTSWPRRSRSCARRAKRTLGQRHFDVQLIGGMVLHHGGIAEMKTGEGKTLVATLAAYLNALEGKGVHVVTVNDYLARRDADWMGRVYGFLGLIGRRHRPAASTRRQRRAAYACDITYGTNNEFGFDYLRDNMKSCARGDGPARPPLRDRRRGRLAS